MSFIPWIQIFENEKMWLYMYIELAQPKSTVFTPINANKTIFIRAYLYKRCNTYASVHVLVFHWHTLFKESLSLNSLSKYITHAQGSELLLWSFPLAVGNFLQNLLELRHVFSAFMRIKHRFHRCMDVSYKPADTSYYYFHNPMFFKVNFEKAYA